MADAHQSPPPDQPLEGRYANAFHVGHNAFEFLLDFGQSVPEREQPQMHTRIITAPAYAKAFAAVLSEAITKYEAAFGVIPQGDS
jgi:hypothetical protein